MRDLKLWELIIKVASTIIAAASLFFAVRNQVRKSRQALKVDLEILGLLKDKSMQNVVEENIRTRVRRLYGKPEAGSEQTRIHHPSMFIFGCITLVVFSIWSVYLNRSGFNWWSLLTIFFAVGGLGNIMSGLQPRKRLETEGNDTRTDIAES